MALESLLGVKKNFIRPGLTELEEEDPFHIKNFNNPMQLSIPPMANPLSSRVNFDCDEYGRSTKLHFDHGTTTLGFIFKSGVILAVDSRATGGKYIGSQSMKKIIEINKFLVGTMAGGAADCVYWDRVLSKQCQLFELRNKNPISTAAASKLMANMAFSYKGTGLSMGMMIAGWDKNGPSLYYVDSEGQRTKSTVFSVGSGSIYAFGVLDSGHSFELEDQEAYELARRSIYYATFRDSFSGGIIRVYHIKPTGWEVISQEDCSELHYKYKSEGN
ncbi:proteasome subunit beta type-5 [Halyomorpha halys]|uniref:proteasome subunit beta type-5 n=1 Tax=Halyomorpha halys TaxID=286706 RepID=UPI0006D524CD|nr:proteasome subunit beta type-5-like [Halyomorpha halys]